MLKKNVFNSQARLRDYERPISVFGRMFNDTIFNNLINEYERSVRNLSDIQKLTTLLIEKHNKNIQDFNEQLDTLKYCQELGLLK